MSRNKDIKSLHSVMGLKYSYLRKRLKSHRWNYWATYWELQIEKFRKLMAEGDSENA